MPHYCCVPLCTSDGRRDKGVSFFSWPYDSEMSKRWIIAIRRDVGPYFKLTKSTRVCSKHFHEDDFESTTQFTLRRRIKKSAIPSIFAWTNKEGIWSTVRSKGSLKIPKKMNEMDANVSSMDIYIKTEPVDPENETTPSTSSLGNQTGTQQQHNVYNSPVLSSITTEQHHVYSSPVLSSITTEQHHVSNSPVLSSMLGSRPNPTPRGVLWTPHGPSHDNSVQGVDRGLSSSLSGQGPTQTDATNKSLSLQKYGKQISFNSAATKLTRLASQYIENESDPKESQLKNSENWNNKSQGTSDKKHRAFPVSMVKTDAVKTIPVGEPNNENPADGVEDAVINFSIRQGLVDAIVKVFISVSREKSNLININNKGDGFSTISALIADQILSKYLVIPKHVPVSKTAKNEEGRKGGGKELVSQNADTSSVDNDLILNVKVECNSPSDFTQDQTMTDDSQEFCTSAESSSYVNRENHEEKFIKKQQTENHDARSDDFMVKTTEGTETPPEENYSSLQTDTDIDIKMEVETDSECEGDDVNNDDDTEDDNALSNIHTVHNTDGTMKILLPNPKVLENFNRRRGISVDISRENTHGNPEVTERDTSSFSTLKQALIPTGSIKVSSVDNSLPCLHARSPIDPHEELLALQEKAKIGNLTPGEKKKLVEIIEIKQNYNYRKQIIQEEIQPANLNIPNMPTDVPQIKSKLHQFDPSQELLALQEKARVGHLTDEEKKTFIDIIEVQQRYKQMNKKSHSSDQQNPDSKQSEMQTDTLSVEKPMIPFTYEEDTSGLDRNLFYCFRCKLCGKTFKHAGTLKVHERSHGIEAEEFKCPVCGKVCSAQSYLSIHMRTHDKESKEETKYKNSIVVGTRKTHLAIEDEQNAVISNERRIKSLALKQIRKQVARLTQLQTIELSIVFCVVDKSQKRQLSKYCGKGDLLDKLKLSRPLLDKNELKQSRAWDEEVFIPKSIKKMAVPTVTPTKLPCGQGLPRSIAKRQRDLVETTVIATSGNDQNDQLISIDIDTPPRRKKTTRRQLGKGKSNQTKNNRKKRIGNTTCTSSSSSRESEGETNQPQEENPIHTVSVDDPDIAPGTSETTGDPMQGDEDSLEDEKTWLLNKYYAVAFDNTFYPGKVIEVIDNDWAVLNYLHPTGKKYQWPAKEDSMKTHKDAMLCPIEIKQTGRFWEMTDVTNVTELYDKRSRCSFCDTSFSSKENLVIHERVHKGSKLYKCEECDLGFTRKQQLKDHITIHTGNFMSATNGRRSPKILGKTKGYNGDFCSVPDCSNSRGKCNRMGKKVSFYQFPKDEKRREAWLRVIRRDSVIVTDGVQKTVPFTPNKSSRVCSEHFVEGVKVDIPGHQDYIPSVFPRNTNSTRQTKRYKIIGERPFVCEHCDKTFRQKGSLKLHLNTHFGDKPFKCDMCGVGFLRKVHYEKHLRKHKGIRPFECEECGKDFTDKLNLKSHQKVHKDKKDHVCDKCGKGFIQSTHYKNHLKFHEGLTGYTCEICEERFEQRAKLRDHVLDSHRDKEEYASKFRARRKSKNSTNQSLLCHENSNNSDISRDSLDRSEENADNEGGHLTNSAAAEEYSTERPQRSSRKRKINYNETNNDSDSDTEVEEEESLVTIKTEPVDCDTE